MTVLDYLINSNMDKIIAIGKEHNLASLKDAIEYVKEHREEFLKELSLNPNEVNMTDLDGEFKMLSEFDYNRIYKSQELEEEYNAGISSRDKRDWFSIKTIIFATTLIVILLLGLLLIKSANATNDTYTPYNYNKTFKQKIELVKQSIYNVEQSFLSDTIELSPLQTFTSDETKIILVEQFFNNLDDLYDAGIKDIAGYEYVSQLDEWIYLYENYGEDFIIEKIMDNYLSGDMEDYLTEFYNDWNRINGELYLYYGEDYFNNDEE